MNPPEGPESPSKPRGAPGRHWSPAPPTLEAPGALSNAFERGFGTKALADSGTTDQIGGRPLPDQVARTRPANGRQIPGKPITAAQLQLIHVAKSQTGISETRYRQMLRDEADVRSSKELTDKGFEAVMRWFAVVEGFVHRPKHPRVGGKRPGMATQRQIDLIRHLWRGLARDPSDAALNHWLHGKFGVETLRFVTAETSTKVIAGLRAWAARSSGATHGTADRSSRCPGNGEPR